MCSFRWIVHNHLDILDWYTLVTKWLLFILKSGYIKIALIENDSKTLKMYKQDLLNHYLKWSYDNQQTVFFTFLQTRFIKSLFKMILW